MQLTKYEHACFVLEKNNRTLVVDPGVLTTDFTLPDQVDGVIITHQHSDHFDIDHLQQLADANPALMIVAPADVANSIPAPLVVTIATPGETVHIGTFSVQFFGGQHAVIHDSLPRPNNLAVLIDDAVYYPGDSFTLPGVAVNTLALPVTAPWLKISEVMDFLQAVHPHRVFPTHDAIASPNGKAIVDRMLSAHAKARGISYQRLTEPLSITK